MNTYHATQPPKDETSPKQVEKQQQQRKKIQKNNHLEEDALGGVVAVEILGLDGHDLVDVLALHQIKTGVCVTASPA
jgi:hypothetical protein